MQIFLQENLEFYSLLNYLYIVKQNKIRCRPSNAHTR